MTTLDQFESVFKSAVKPLYRHQSPTITHGLIVTDLDQQEANTFASKVQQLSFYLEFPNIKMSEDPLRMIRKVLFNAPFECSKTNFRSCL